MPKPRAIEEPMTEGAVEMALDLGLLTERDLLRLKAVARLHARGLPGGVDWSDLLQEAVARSLRGSRRRPAGITMVAFLAGVMRSIRAEHWRRAARESLALGGPPPLRALVEEASDPAPDPERMLAAQQALAEIDRLFADDRAAMQILAGLGDGLSAEAIREVYGMSKTDYDSTRRRMRRTLLRVGLSWDRPR